MHYRSPRDIRRHYVLTLGTIRRARASIALALGLTLMGVTVGVLQADWLRGSLASFDLTPFRSPYYYRRVFAYFSHNALSNYLVLWLGRWRGIVPALDLIANGAALSAVITVAMRTHPISELFPLLVPHGVFELPANLTASALGLWVGAAAWTEVPLASRRKRRRRANRVFLLVVLPLLVIAAAIEARP